MGSTSHIRTNFCISSGLFLSRPLTLLSVQNLFMTGWPVGAQGDKKTLLLTSQYPVCPVNCNIVHRNKYFLFLCACGCWRLQICLPKTSPCKNSLFERTLIQHIEHNGIQLCIVAVSILKCILISSGFELLIYLY